jgi:uroporphyrinogen decarboxylase
MTGNLQPGERVVRCLLGQPTDHVPYGIGIGWAPWGETLERWRAETGRGDLDPAAELGFERSFITPALHAGLFPWFTPEVLDQDDRFVIHRDERGIVMRNRRDGGSMPEFLRHPVASAEDWLTLKAERLDPTSAGRIPQDWDAFRSHIEKTGEAVQVGWFPYGVFGTPRDLMGVEALLYAMHDEPDLVRDMMEHLTDLWIALWSRVADEVRIDHIHIWEDMSGRDGPLISPAMVRRFMMPCYDRIAAFARDRGVRIVSVDTDGDCSLLVPIFMEHGINMMFPFEVQAGNDIEDYRRRYPSLGIMGGLDKRALACGPAEVDREIELAQRMVARGRYIPGFDHLIPPDVPWDTFRYAAEKMRAVCGL